MHGRKNMYICTCGTGHNQNTMWLCDAWHYCRRAVIILCAQNCVRICTTKTYILESTLDNIYFQVFLLNRERMSITTLPLSQYSDRIAQAMYIIITFLCNCKWYTIKNSGTYKLCSTYIHINSYSRSCWWETGFVVYSPAISKQADFYASTRNG